MENILELLHTNPDNLLAGNGCSEDDIEKAEHALGVKLASDYRACLLEFGVFAFGGHEFTGITDDKRVSLVKATAQNWNMNDNVPHDLYVIEETNIDGIIVWQATDATIYASQNNSAPVVIASNLIDFIKKDASM